MSHTQVHGEKADGPLTGLIVIDMTQWYAGPLATTASTLVTGATWVRTNPRDFNNGA